MAIKDVNGEGFSSGGIMSQIQAEMSAGAATDESQPEENPEDSTGLGDDESGEQLIEEEEGPEGVEQEVEAAEAPSVKFKADGKEFNFSLKPDDQNLINTLKWGAIGKRLQSERDKARDDVKSAQKEMKALQSQLSDLAQMRELVDADFLDRAIMKVVGPEKFKEWDEKRYQERLNREAVGEGSAEVRLKELEDIKRYQEWEAKKLRDSAEAERNERWMRDENARIQNAASQALSKYNFSKLGVSGELAEKYNQKMYKNAMSAVEELASNLPEGESLSPQQIEAAFKAEYTEFAALIGHAASHKADKTVQKMKQEAKTKAGTIAKQGAGGATKQDFSGMRMTDVLKRVMGKS